MSVDLELAQAAAKYKNKQKVKDRFISGFIGIFAIVWIFPIAWTIWTSLRPYKDVRANGLFSIPKTLNLDNYAQAISRMDLPLYFTWRVSLLYLAPWQVSQETYTSGRKFISIFSVPSPLQASQRPPLTLKENLPCW